MKESRSFGRLEEHLLAVPRCVRVASIVLKLRQAIPFELQAAREGQQAVETRFGFKGAVFFVCLERKSTREF